MDPLPQYTTTYSTGESYWVKEGYEYGYHTEYLKYKVDDSIETKIEYVNGYIILR